MYSTNVHSRNPRQNKMRINVEDKSVNLSPKVINVAAIVEYQMR